MLPQVAISQLRFTSPAKWWMNKRGCDAGQRLFAVPCEANDPV
jgi:hypothetical protein